MDNISNKMNIVAEKQLANYNTLNNIILNITDTLNNAGVSAEATSTLATTLGEMAAAYFSSAVEYNDGVTETSYGQIVADNKKKFRFELKDQYRILNNSPLGNGSSLYGSMMLGVPFLFNKKDDPRNRTLINSLIKDSRYISFVPGMPKYTGSSYTASSKDKYNLQTPTTNKMLEYLKLNGLTSTFNEKDKRYYSFKPDYNTYYSYLETMLNIIWIKMGLGKETKDKKEIISLYSFFGGEDGLRPLKEEFKTAIGFFSNINNSVSESIDNQTTGFGSELANEVNGRSDDFQRINYITGMGRR